MNIHRASLLAAFALPAIVAFNACVAGTEGDSPASQETIGTTSQAIGQATCATTTANATFSGSISQYLSPPHYSNAKCWGAVVVDFSRLPNPYGDLVIADAKANLNDWNPGNILPPPRNPAPPSPASTGPIFALPVRILPGTLTSVPPDLTTQAECESKFIGAMLYRDGVQIATQTVYGKWVPQPAGVFVIGGGSCQLPVVSFGGASYRGVGEAIVFDFDHQYRVAATYRNGDTAPIKMLPLQIVTVAPRCGGIGQRCCGSSALISCSAGMCNGTTCNACGRENQPACPAQLGACAPNQSPRITPVAGFCRACGDEGQRCCAIETWLTACNSRALQCSAGTCAKPGAVTPPPHQGGPGELCHPGGTCDDSPGYGCFQTSDGQRCLPASQSVSPSGNCGNPDQPCCEPTLVGGSPWCITSSQTNNHCGGTTCTVRND